MAIFAHPDDESLACGGVLARCAELGAHVTLVCATHGENRSGVRDDDWYDVRARELREAAAVLGIADVVLFDYPDGFLPWADAAEIESRLLAEINRVQPEVVITFGQDGLYWHPDHIAVHQRTTAVVALLGDAAPALYYVTMVPKSMRRLVDALSNGDQYQPALLLGIVDPDGFGVWAAPPSLVVDVQSTAARKLQALQCHRTQVAQGLLQRMTPAEAPRLLGVEHFHRAPVGSQASSFLESL